MFEREDIMAKETAVEGFESQWIWQSRKSGDVQLETVCNAAEH